MLKPVGFFGGAFSPLHCGHIRMVFAVLEGGHVSRVILVPASDAYRKPGLIPAEKRLVSLRSMFGQMGSVEISTIDTDKAYFPHPMETASELIMQRVEGSWEELIWIIGGDRLDWIIRNDDLRKMVAKYRFIVFERPPYSLEQLCKHPKIQEVIDRLVFLPPIPFLTQEKHIE